MKNILSILLFTLALSPIVALDFAAGIKGGLGVALTTGPTPVSGTYNNLSISPTLRGNIGLYFELGLHEFFALQPQMFLGINNSLTLKNDDYDKGVYGGYIWTASYNSVDIELMFKGRFVNKMLYIGLAPSLSLGLGMVKMFDQELGFYPNVASVSFAESGINRIRFALTIEGGSEMPLGRGMLLAGLKTQWYLTSLFNNGFAANLRLHNSLSMQLGYGFRF